MEFYGSEATILAEAKHLLQCTFLCVYIVFTIDKYYYVLFKYMNKDIIIIIC